MATAAHVNCSQQLNLMPVQYTEDIDMPRRS